MKALHEYFPNRVHVLQFLCLLWTKKYDSERVHFVKDTANITKPYDRA